MNNTTESILEAKSAQQTDSPSSTGNTPPRREGLIKRIKELGPWHMGIQLTDTLNTGEVFDESGNILVRDDNAGISLLQLRDHFLKKIDQIYPQGLADKTFLDCACNAGGYCFWAQERNVKSATGFDVREHWIRQARFIKNQRTVAPTDRTQFFVSDLYDLPNKKLQPADITMFKGIFYHLPDPITGLKIAADLTNEVMFFNTSTTWGEPDGYLKCGWESRERLMSGVHGLKWYATGPKVISDMLKWVGFSEQRFMFSIQQYDQPQLGRIEIIASKKPGLLDDIGGQPIGND